ncbi:hypothetical protein [Albidovulum sp.]|jgi:hypothetical protein|uniref:hypothetical protein n=1 Tax=Albidovulum sp. TaxID=1872424 RepID=UPI00304B4781
MTARAQRLAAIAGAVLAATVFVGANAHLLTVAIGSQPGCVAEPAAMPAKSAC